MATDDNDKPTSFSGSEMNRHLHDIFDKRDDPRYLEQKKIDDARAARLDKTDLSLWKKE